MRSLARLFAALAAVALAPLVFVWEGGRWVLRTVAGVRPDPVLPTAVAAEESAVGVDVTAKQPVVAFGGANLDGDTVTPAGGVDEGQPFAAPIMRRRKPRQTRGLFDRQAQRRVGVDR